MNDLCFFRSLSKLVQEHEREIEHSAANKDKFWNLIVEQYYKIHDRETLERCSDVKTAVTKCILDAKGTNNYKLPHGRQSLEPIDGIQSFETLCTDDEELLTQDDLQSVLGTHVALYHAHVARESTTDIRTRAVAAGNSSGRIVYNPLIGASVRVCR